MSPTKSTSQLLTRMRKLMVDKSLVPRPLSAYIVPSCDAHNSEYLASRDERRSFASGFTGSAGVAVITAEQALMWTDGRYHAQALKEMDQNWTLIKVEELWDQLTPTACFHLQKSKA
jgi:Xaa-Pro aminopeptidase